MTDAKHMLSRVVDSLYWMSRYLERAEHTSRLLDVYVNLMLEKAPGTVEQQRANRLLKSLNLKSTDAEGLDNLLHWLTFNPDNSHSILANITAARENARQVREQTSSEMWMQINKLFLHVKEAGMNNTWMRSPHDFYVEVREGAHLFQGITDATMNHNQGWHFIQIGRYIERTLGLLQLLKTHFTDDSLTMPPELTTAMYFELVAILKSVSAFEAYCKVFNPNVQTSRMIAFLLFDEQFPRSLRFCVDTTLHSMNALADATMRSKNTRLYRVAGRLQSQLSFDEVSDITSLHEYLESVKQQIYQIHDMLYDTYITYPIEMAL
ncbi:MAG: alpha-E domain-containing protein [Anaerolineae bacterium]